MNDIIAHFAQIKACKSYVEFHKKLSAVIFEQL